jgi:endoglucanase
MIYSFLLHFFAWIASVFHSGPVATVRIATHEVAAAHTVQAAMRVPDSGYWHTRGNMILDRQNRPVRIQAINWYGFETVRQAPGGLTEQDYRTILQIIRDNGFNTVRIPFSNKMVEQPKEPTAISFRNEHGPINSDLSGLSSLQILDRIVEYAGQLGLKVILDNHRSEAGDSAEANGLWYTGEYPEARWMADWMFLAQRYSSNSTVVGMDLRNEPHGAACWDCGGERDWHLAAQRAGNAVLHVNPQLVIFVEGIDVYGTDAAWWGGNLEGVRRSPVRLETPGQLVYSAHSYGPNEYRQSWFTPTTTAASLEAVETRHWAFVALEGIAPVWLGEFGTTNRTEDIVGTEPGSEGQWFQTMVSLLAKHPELGWGAWALNGEDAKSILDDRYSRAASPLKMQMMARIELPAPLAVATADLENARVPHTPRSEGHEPQNMLPQGAVLQPASYVSTRAASNVGPACRVNYNSRSDTGYTATEVVEIENLSNRQIDDWTLVWSYRSGQQVEEVRNARFLQNGDVVMMTGNGAIPPGGKLTGIAVTTSYRGENQRPASFYLNGSLCG